MKFSDNTMSVLRNFSDIDQSLREIKRIIKKGVKFYCLDFSQINNRSLRG